MDAGGGSSGGLLPDLTGQPGWVVVAVVLIASAAWVITHVWRRAGNDGGGAEGLRQIDSAAEFLTEKALEERGLRQDAERDRQQTLTELEAAKQEIQQKAAELEACDQHAQEMAHRAVEEERRRSSGAT